ncbi:hypothetical protein [Streptococcus anginosus]|uniref:hypothetical protein n=2 Tax=Streptococcus anginosus TaxID=1328 RepID=UPI00398D0E2B
MAATQKYGWSEQIHEAMMQSWCNSMDFAEVLTALATTDLSVRANQTNMLQLLSAAHKKAPFSETTRFPSDAAYVQLTHPRLAPLIENIIAALSTSDRAEELDRNFKDATVAQKKYQAKQDAKLAVTKTVSALRQLVVGGAVPLSQRHAQGVFTQKTFEENFNVEWK